MDDIFRMNYIFKNDMIHPPLIIIIIRGLGCD